VPKTAQPWIATLVRTVFDQPDTDAVRAQFDRVMATIEAKFPVAAEHLDAARDDLLAFTGFPREIWRQIWSNNPQERLNKEIRRRTDVVGIFPNRAAIIRLVGAVLAEQTDEWAEAPPLHGPGTTHQGPARRPRQRIRPARRWGRIPTGINRRIGSTRISTVIVFYTTPVDATLTSYFAADLQDHNAVECS
jgi:Transposase, Mutator family